VRLPALVELHAYRAPALEHDAGRQRIRLHGKVRPAAGGLEISIGRAAAPPMPREELVVTDALLLRTVEVVVARNAELVGPADDRLDELVRIADIGAP
jgi:hypothetical protein